MPRVKKLDLGMTALDELFMNDKERAENKLPKIFDMVLNDMIHSCDISSPDIIIAGSQSGTISIANANVSMMMTNQYEFLLGIWPDAVILCVNDFDDIDYIKRTVMFIESSIKCKVIAMIIFEGSLKKGDTSLNISELKKCLDKKIYIGHSGCCINDLVMTIEEFFS